MTPADILRFSRQLFNLWRDPAKTGSVVVTLILAFTLLGNISLVAEERDPFVSILDLRKERFAASQNRIDLSKVILKGILWNNKQPVAIINDELVMVGDDWQGYKLERIDRDSILLSDGTNTYKLSVTEDMPNFSKNNLLAKPEGVLENGMTNNLGGRPLPSEMQGMYPQGMYPDRGYIPGNRNYPIEGEDE